MKRILREHIELWESGGTAPPPDPGVLAEYERRALTKRLAGVFDALIGASGPESDEAQAPVEARRSRRRHFGPRRRAASALFRARVAGRPLRSSIAVPVDVQGGVTGRARNVVVGDRTTRRTREMVVAATEIAAV